MWRASLNPSGGKEFRSELCRTVKSKELETVLVGDWQLKDNCANFVSLERQLHSLWGTGSQERYIRISAGW